VQRGRTVLLTTHYLEEADALADRIVVLNRGSSVAAGSPAEIKSLTAGRRIRCVTRLAPAAVARLPGVSGVTQHSAALEILAAQAEPVVLALLSQDPGLSDLEVSGVDLEQAFLNLTREAQKEAA
jgi:ABC-2 type transport system ATP-binding protein